MGYDKSRVLIFSLFLWASEVPQQNSQLIYRVLKSKEKRIRRRIIGVIEMRGGHCAYNII
jgi:hypothetical protein